MEPVPLTPVPLMWSQEHYWYGRYARPRVNTRIPVTWRLPYGRTHAHVTSAVRALVHRHPALRTTFPAGEDGRPVQRVHPPEASALTAVEPLVARSPEELGHVVARLTARDLDPEREHPARYAHVTGDGTAGHLVAVFHHIAVDAASIEQLWREFTESLGVGGRGHPEADTWPERPEQPQRPERPESDAWTPVDQARLDHSPEQSAYRSRAAAHQERCLRAAPRRLFPAFRPLPLPLANENTNTNTNEESDGPHQEHQPAPTYWRLTLQSHRLHPAAERLSARYRILPSVVYFGAFASLLARASGRPDLVIRTAFSTRPPTSPAAVGCFFQRSLAAVTLPSADPDGSADPGEPAASTREVLRAARDAYTDAWEFSRHSYQDARRAHAAEEARREEAVRLSVSYGYFASDVMSRVWPQVAADQPEMTVRAKDPGKYDNDADLNLEVFSAEENRVELSLLVHRSLYDEPGAARLLRELAALVLEWDAAPWAPEVP